MHKKFLKIRHCSRWHLTYPTYDSSILREWYKCCWRVSYEM